MECRQASKKCQQLKNENKIETAGKSYEFTVYTYLKNMKFGKLFNA